MVFEREWGMMAWHGGTSFSRPAIDRSIVPILVLPWDTIQLETSDVSDDHPTCPIQSNLPLQLLS